MEQQKLWRVILTTNTGENYCYIALVHSTLHALSKAINQFNHDRINQKIISARINCTDLRVVREHREN